MQIVQVLQAGRDYHYKWPSGDSETYLAWIEYEARADNGTHTIRIGFGTRPVYGQARPRVVVWIDGHPQAEFFGADDYAASGELLTEIRVRGEVGELMCRYPTDAIPDRYTAFTTVGLPTRVNAKGARSAWAAVTNLADHKTMIALAALRRLERQREK